MNLVRRISVSPTFQSEWLFNPLEGLKSRLSYLWTWVFFGWDDSFEIIDSEVPENGFSTKAFFEKHVLLNS